MSHTQVTMDCRTFSEIVADLDRGKALAPVVREAALLHAENCADCGMVLTESEALDRQLSSLAASAGSAPREIEERLAKEFRAELQGGRSERTQWLLAALATAAAAVFVASLFLGGRNALRSGGASGQTTFAQGANLSPAPSETPRQVAASTPLKEATAASHEHATASVARPASENTSTAEGNEAVFIPLPYADSASQLGGGQVVRVVMSPEALASLGVQTNVMNSTGEISADLLLDEDGTPEAIRLVAQAEASTAPN